MMQSGFESNINENKPSVKNLRTSERVVSWFTDYVSKCLRAKDIKVDPFDTLVMKTHYNFTSHLFLTVFVFVISHWLAEEPAICVDRSDRSSPPEELLEICITYSYAEFPYNNDKNRMVRRYALHYKWVHIACLFISFVYKGVLIPQAILRNRNHQKMLKELCEAKLADRFVIVERYFQNHEGCHKRMYARFMYLHFITLCINILSFWVLDLTFQNQYWDLPKYLFVKRDPTSFHDPFSLVFPPFTLCEITSVHHVLVERTKWFGCHLPLMEIYEKVFMTFWFWQVMLALWTIIFILYNVPLSFCYNWKLNLLGNSSYNRFDPFKSCAKCLATDEIFALRAIGTLILGDDYARLLSSLLENKGREDPNTTIYYDSLNKNFDTNLHLSFHSCNQEKNDRKDTPPLGFEAFPSPFKPPIDLDPVPKPELDNVTKVAAENPYSAWKRNLSLEFDAIPVKRSMAFDNKLYPLMQYLRRDENLLITTSTPIMNEENWTQHAYQYPQNPYLGRCSKGYYTGGEKEAGLDDKYDWEGKNNEDLENVDSLFTESASAMDCDNKWKENDLNYDTNGKTRSSTILAIASQRQHKIPEMVEWTALYRNKHNWTATRDVNPKPDQNWDEENWDSETESWCQGKRWH